MKSPTAVAYWSEPERVRLTFEDQAGIFPGYRIRYVIGVAIMGSVCWYSEEGPFYTFTQARRLGPCADLDRAKQHVEVHGLNDVVSFATLGTA
jgi:hypothetical protein